MAFHHKYNTEDVFFRGVTVALIGLLSNRIKLWNVLDDFRKEEIPIPFYYEAGGDERFLQDIYLKDSVDECIQLRPVEGNIEVIPRGIVKKPQITISPSSLTNRYVRVQYVKEVKGELQTFSARANIIPVEMSYECEVWVDSSLDLDKFQQRIIETLYKIKVFTINFEGMAIRCMAGFPDDTSPSENRSYTFGDDTEKRVSFTVTVSSNLIVRDLTTEFHASNVMENIVVQ